MPEFRILYFRENVLEGVERLHAPDLIAAVGRAFRRAPYLAAEIWSRKGKVGIVRPSIG